MRVRQDGFTLVELLVAVSIFSVVLLTGQMVLISGQGSWSLTNTKILLQENMRTAFLRIAGELQESGKDAGGNVQVTVVDNGGVNGSDIVRFSIPLCVCGSIMDANTDVANWGAPLQWKQSGCSTVNYTLEQNGKVKICHLPPGNPGNVQDLQVSVSALPAHLAHGDSIGECGACSVSTNKFIEYRINASNQMVRRVLTDALVVVQEEVVVAYMQDLQAVLSGDGRSVTLSTVFEKTSEARRVITMSESMNVILRNAGG